MNNYFIKYREGETDIITDNIVKLGGLIEYISPVLPIMAFNGTLEVEQLLRKRFQLEYIIESPRDGSFLDEGSFMTHFTPLQIIPRIEAIKLRSVGLTGWGVNLAVLDSGISEEWVKDRYDFTGYGSDPVIDHGNKVANIAKRFARGSKIISCKVGQNYHDVKLIDTLKGIDFAVTQANIVNMSLGFEIDSCIKGACPICDVVNYYVHNKGVLFVTAAGNFGHEGSISCPGRSSEVITVGSIKQQHLETAEYSSKGVIGFNKPNILTSGTIYFNHKHDEGTSYSAPIITGVSAALMTGLSLTPADIKDYLYSTATKIYNIPDHHQGFGVFNLEKVLEVWKDNESAAKGKRQD